MADTLSLHIPFRLDSTQGMNGSHGAWRTRQAKVDRQRGAVASHWLTVAAEARTFALPLVISMTRIGPAEMDDDGVVSCFKSMRDEVAERLGFNDRSKLAQWVYGQRQGARARRASVSGGAAKPAEWGVEIVIERARCLACGELLSEFETKRTRFGFLHTHHNLPGGLR